MVSENTKTVKLNVIWIIQMVLDLILFYITTA